MRDTLIDVNDAFGSAGAASGGSDGSSIEVVEELPVKVQQEIK